MTCSCPSCYNHRFGCQIYRKIYWCYGSFALVYEYWYKTRITRTWVVSPDLKNHRPRLLFERSSEDAYSNPGSPVMCRTPAGTLVIARIKRNCEGSYILLKGRGATPKGSTPFLDLFDVYVFLHQSFKLHISCPILYSFEVD